MYETFTNAYAHIYKHIHTHEYTHSHFAHVYTYMHNHFSFSLPLSLFQYIYIPTYISQLLIHHTSDCFSFAGPDGTKVGQDLSIEMAVATTGLSKQVAIAAAQVLPLRYPIWNSQYVIANTE